MSIFEGHKLNVKSSTEAELVGIDNALPGILWGKYFIEAQGHVIDYTIILEDNKSTILHTTNGNMSSSKKTKHISHIFFKLKIGSPVEISKSSMIPLV